MKISLVCGRMVELVEMRTWRTYRGMLAGLPHRSINEDYVERAMEFGREIGPSNCEPYLVVPHIEMTGRAIRGLTVEEERLPPVACIGLFDSGALARPGSEPYSSLAIVWFQGEIASPIPENVLSGIRHVDWENRAKDWIW